MPDDINPGADTSQPVPDYIERGLDEVTSKVKWEQESRCTIFRVGKQEKSVKPHHFEHQLISLGLYDSKDRSRTQKQEGDAFRLEIVSALLKDLGKKVSGWRQICHDVVQHPEEMRKLYDEPDDLSDEDIRSILTLDAMFLACYLSTCYYVTFPVGDKSKFVDLFPHVVETVLKKSKTFRKMILMDIIKLENQIPLSLIESTLNFMILGLGNRREETNGPPQEHITNIDADQQVEVGEQVSKVLDSMCTSLSDEYKCSLPFFDSTFVFNQDVRLFERCSHLLDCLYTSMLGTPELKKSPRNTIWQGWNKISHYKYLHGGTSSLPPVSRLYEAGVIFQGNKDDFFWVLPYSKISKINKQRRYAQPKPSIALKKSIFKATLVLPSIPYMTSDCEPLWRNLLAYENKAFGSGAEFMSYLVFMDQLIDTEKDVDLLSGGREPVICTNGLGTAKAVADVFNSILLNYDVNSEELFYQWRDLRKEIRKFYYSKTKRNLMEFRRKPWMTLSISTTGIFLLTLLQTIYTMK